MELKWWRTAAVLGFLLLLTAGFYWKITITGEYTWMESPDTANVVQPWLDYESRQIHAGRLPLWDPYQWGGQPLVGQVQPGLLNPLNWILFAVPLRDGHIPPGALQWYWVLIHWLGAVFCYALCRDLEAGVMASILGACIFALTGAMGHLDWPQILMGAIWTPLVLLFFARAFRGERLVASGALCGAALGMEFLSGHYQVPMSTALLLGCLWVWLLVERRRERKAWAAAAAFAAVWLLVSAVQVLPAIDYGHQALRWAGAPEPLAWNGRVPFAVHKKYSLPPRAFLGLVVPGVEAHVSPFTGMVALGLALVALHRGWRTRNVRLAAAVAAGGLLLALGGYNPLYRAAYEALPMLEKARLPAMAVVLGQLGIAALAALGLDYWLRGERSKTAALAVAAAGFALWAAYWTLNLDARSAVVAAVALALAAGMHYGHALPRRWAAAAALALFLVEAVAAASHLARFDRPGSYARLKRDQEDVAEFLKRQPGWFRVETNEDDVPYLFGDWFGIDEFSGDLSSIPEKVERVLGQAETPRRFGVRYYVARQPARNYQEEVFTSRSGVKVFRDAAIAEPLWAARATPCSVPDRLRVVRRVPGVFDVQAEMGCAGLVATGEPRFSGWRAWVDGRRVVIQELEGVVRAVPVPAGAHRIEFRYEPWILYGGAAASVLGLLLALAAWRLDRG